MSTERAEFMAVNPESGFSPSDARAEVAESQRELFSLFLCLLPLGVFIWYYVVVFADQDSRLSVWPLLVCLAGLIGGWRLHKKWHVPACWWLLAHLAVIIGLLITLDLSPLTPALGIVLLIAAYALLDTWQALLSVPLATLAVTFAQEGRWTSPFQRPGLDALALYLLTWVLLWLAGRPLQSLIASALNGWAQARRNLAELQDRRAELLRAMHALEEATNRMERLNNQLVVAQQEAETARAIKSRLTATVSHELRGPLNLILGFSELMALAPETYRQPLPEAYRSDILTIYRNSKHLLALIDDILNLSKIEAQQLSLVKDWIDFNQEVVRKVSESIQPLVERKGLYLRQELDASLPVFMADAVRLRQVLLNLLTNALRFTERGGITIRTAYNDQVLRVSVQDTGTGIAEEDLPKLFKEFYQVQKQRTEGEQEGTGLGLAISKHLIELHGGHIWVESKKGVGTTFHFTLPVADAQATALPTVRTASRSRELPVDCLLVHEDPRVAGLIGRYLEGIHVMGVSNEHEVPSLVEKLCPRAIIADPQRTESIVARLRRAGLEVPLITCTMPALEREELFRGVMRFLVKPVTHQFLLEAVNQVARPDGETTILLVDDEPDTVRLMERMLTSLPRFYRILKAYDGLQAWEMIQKTLPDIVFLDLLMPRMDGWALIQRLQADERTRQVPIVVVSAYDWLEERAVLGTPIALHTARPLNIATGAKCIQTLVSCLPASFSLRPAQPESP